MPQPKNKEKSGKRHKNNPANDMTAAGRARKRSASVCVRCRRQKIKCSGSQPCQSCDKRGISCIFNHMDQKVLVTRRYITELQRKVTLIEDSGTEVTIPENFITKEFDHDATPEEETSRNPEDNEESQETDDSEHGLVNPLAADPPAFMSPGNGRIFYMGTSSNWSFTRRLLSVAHQHTHKEALPTESLIFEGGSYDLGWDGWRTSQILADPVIPNLEHALHLINTVKFRCGGLFHLYEENDFTTSLYAFYSHESPDKGKSLWYIHFLLILAFGKTFAQPRGHDNRPPGLNYFVKALQMLPDHHLLYSSPMVSTEILCCIALFYQSLDYRSPAHNYIGQAMRMAMAHGMHTRMPVGDLGLDAVERCRNIWWTVYIMDRNMSTIQGLPQSIDDRFIQTDLPSSSKFSERDAALDMHIKLCRSMAEINSTVYGIDGRIDSKFLLSTKAALSNIAVHADELSEAFPLHLDAANHGISRVSAYLHLLYQQCVIVATRPLLFCFLKVRLDSPEKCAELLAKSRHICNIIQMCLESAQHSIRILHGLKSQGLLETFLNFDLESIFISTVVILMRPVIDPESQDDRHWWLEKSYSIFQEMIEATNQVAKFRWLELQQLKHTLSFISQGDNSTTGTHALAQNVHSREFDTAPQMFSSAPSYNPASMEQSSCDNFPYMEDSTLELEYGLGPVMSTAEMMAMADSIEIYDAEWLSSTMINYDV